MLDDAVLLQGRHTKRKWKTIVLLLLAAAFTLFAALAAAHPESATALWKNILSRFSREPGNAWVSADYTIQARPLLLGSSVFYMDRGWGTISAMDGTVRSRTPLEADCTVRAAAWAGCYCPGGNTLTIVGDDTFRTISIPGGIDAAAVSSGGRCAVLTCGSGYRTKTQVFDKAGNLIKEIGLTDRAMVYLDFVRYREILISCTVSTAGAWTLRFDGAETEEYPLDVGMVYDLKPCGDGAALWTNDGILYYGGAGEILGQMPCETLLDWDCDSFAAALSYDGGVYRLRTMDFFGRITESEPLPRIPRQLSVCGNTVCVLDSEQLLVYDKQCHLKTVTPLGASTVSVQADYGGAVLFGDGEFMRYIP